MPKRVALDTCLVLKAWKGREDVAALAMQVLDDDDNEIISSEYSKLELFPKPTCFRDTAELEFLNSIFEDAFEVKSSDAIRQQAYELACKYGLGALDALLIAAAIAGAAEEFVTAEKHEKPMLHVAEIPVRTIHPRDEGATGAASSE